MLLVALWAGAVPASASPPRVALLQTQTRRAQDREVGAVIGDLLQHHLDRAGVAGLLTEADALALLGSDKRKQLEACDEDTACLVEVGGALGVEYLLSSALSSVGSSYLLTLRLLVTRDGSIAARASETVPRDEDALVQATCALVRTLLVGAARADPRLRPPEELCSAAPAAAETKPAASDAPAPGAEVAKPSAPVLAPPPPAAPTAAAAAATAPPAEPAAPRTADIGRTAGWVSTGLGAAALLGAGVFAVLRSSAEAELTGSIHPRAETDRLAAQMSRSATAANALLAAGVALGAGGGVLLAVYGAF